MTSKLLSPSNLHRWIVRPDDTALRLVDYLVSKNPGTSAKSWRKQIDVQAVWVNSSPARFANQKLDPFNVVLHAKVSPQPWTIVSEESEYWVLNKPPGSNYEAGELFLRQLGHKAIPVHRLDAMTTGLLIMAKTTRAQEEFDCLFRTRRIKKHYLAAVWGIPKKATSGTVNERLSERKSPHGGVQVRVGSRGGVGACTHWRHLGSHQGISFLRCEPKSGRTHQIRAHMNHIGLPVIGDRDFLPVHVPRGLRGNLFASYHLLHAHELSFEWDGVPVNWKAEIGKDMRRFAQFMKIDECEFL